MLEKNDDSSEKAEITKVANSVNEQEEKEVVVDKTEQSVNENLVEETEIVEISENDDALKKDMETDAEKPADETVDETLKKEEEQGEVVSTKESDENKAAVDEVEKSVAEDAENETTKSEEVEKVDYSKMSLEDLVSSLKKVIESNPVQSIKSQVELIKGEFNQKFGALLAEKKAAFLEEGGNSIDFYFSSPIKSDYNKLLSDYKKKRDAHYASLEKQLKSNLEKRLEVIELLKTLIDEANPSTMYKEFRKIEDLWKTIGPVPKTQYNDTWKIYHHHVERFYDLLHMSNDFRDLDFKHNLEEKLNIIIKAEALAKENDVNYAAKQLQELHKTWKEDIGPVAREMREEIWRKFSEATKKIHDRRHEYYKDMRSKFQEIIDVKLTIVNQINAYDTSKNKTHNDWQKSIKDIEVLRQQYFNAGKLPYSKSEEVWQKFKSATKKFNTAKNVFYKKEKSGQQDNLQKKLALIEIAESLKDSEDWDMATNAMKKIQSDWKEIGHVPRKFSDDIWKKFKGACNHYFDRLHKKKSAVSSDQQKVVEAKKAFLDQLKTVELKTKEAVLETINEWNELGSLPRNVRHLDGKFNKQIDKILDSLSLDKNEVSMLKFTNVVDSYALDNDARKLDSEQLFVRKKIDEIVREIQQLENNLGFFSNANDDNPLVLNVKKRVSQFKEDLGLWKQKLTYLKNLE